MTLTPSGFSNRSLPSLLCLIGLSILVVGTSLASAQDVDPGRAKRVVMISTGSRFSPGFALVEQSALDTMAKLGPGRIDFYSEYLDIIRFPSESYQRIFRNYLRDKYADNPPDLLMLFYVGNLGIAATLLQQQFPEIPVVVAGFTEEKFAADRLGRMVSGFARNVDPHATMAVILQLQPETRRIVIIGGTAEVDRLVFERAEKAARSFAGRVEFDWMEQTFHGRYTQVGNLAASQNRASVYRDVSRRGRRNFYPRGRCSIDSRIGQGPALCSLRFPGRRRLSGRFCRGRWNDGKACW